MSGDLSLRPHEGAAPGALTVARSLLFAAWMYGLLAVMAIACLPLLLAPRTSVLGPMRLWCRLVLGGLRVICGTRVEVRGLGQHRPPGPPVLVASKHNAMVDTLALFLALDDPAFVLKRELLKLPFFGWYVAHDAMIPIDREGNAKTLRALIADARERVGAGRPVVIFPEGTRGAPGDPPDYKPGVAALYRDLDLPCVPVATNSGLFWPAHGLIRRPGLIVYEALTPIPPGLKRPAFMAELEQSIERATERMLSAS